MKPKPSYKPNISYYYSTQIITIRHQIFSLSKTPHCYCYSRTFFCGIPWSNRHLSNHKMAYVMLKRQSMIKSIGGQSWRRFASVAVGTDLVSAAPNVSLQKARTWDEGVSSNFSTTPLSDIFKGKKVVIFGLPGAFTGVCTAQHVPSYKKNIDKFKAKGVDSVICVSVNDPYTMNGWAEKLEAKEAIEFYGDFDGKFHKSLDLELDLSSALLGHRSTRWSAFVEDGKVKALNVENVPSDFKVSGGEVILGQI